MTNFLDMATGFLDDALRIGGEIADSLAEKKKPGHRAEFMPEDKLISAHERGFRLSGAKSISAKLSYQNALVVGPTGTGKSATVLIPTIMSADASMIINDVSGELLDRTGGILAERGFDVRVLHFGRPDISVGFNLINRANTSSEIERVASMLISGSKPDGKSGDKFWEAMGTGLASMLIRATKLQNPEYATMHNVLHLLTSMGSNPKGVDNLLSRFADDKLYADYQAFLAHDEKIQSSTRATVQAALQVFHDENVAKVTAFDSIDIAEFRKRKIALFVQVPISDSRYLNGILSLFYEQVYAQLFKKLPEDDERDIFFLLDEASSLRVHLALPLANLRKYRVGTLLCIQSEAQLFNNHGKHDAESIMANCYTKMWLSGQDLDTCRKLESILGKIEHTNKDGKKEIFPLMDASAIRMLPLDRAIILAGHHKPILARLVPYYKNRILKRQSMLPVPPLRCRIPFFTIPTINLQTPDDDEED